MGKRQQLEPMEPPGLLSAVGDHVSRLGAGLKKTGYFASYFISIKFKGMYP